MHTPCQAPTSSVWSERWILRCCCIGFQHLAPPVSRKRKLILSSNPHPIFPHCPHRPWPSQYQSSDIVNKKVPWATAGPALYSEQPGPELRLQATRSAVHVSFSGLPWGRIWRCTDSEEALCAVCSLWCSYSTRERERAGCRYQKKYISLVL